MLLQNFQVLGFSGSGQNIPQYVFPNQHDGAWSDALEVLTASRTNHIDLHPPDAGTASGSIPRSDRPCRVVVVVGGRGVAVAVVE